LNRMTFLISRPRHNPACVKRHNITTEKARKILISFLLYKVMQFEFS
jgi:hypothetical protein